MFNHHSTATNTGHDMVDRAAQRSDSMLRAGVDTAHGALNSLNESARRLQSNAADLGQRGLAAWRDGQRAVRDRAHEASERTVGYIQHEPVKSVLVAAAAGAALVALISLLGSRSGR